MIGMMMSLPDDYRMIDEDVAASGQISPAQVADIAAAGYKSIICNRPDGEAEGQSTYAEIAAAAQAAGLAVVHIPVLSSGMTMQDVEATRAALESLERPIYTYCRSGARSTNVYSMAKG